MLCFNISFGPDGHYSYKLYNKFIENVNEKDVEVEEERGKFFKFNINISILYQLILVFNSSI